MEKERYVEPTDCGGEEKGEQVFVNTCLLFLEMPDENRLYSQTLLRMQVRDR
jgi:hypothetical protein